MSKAVFCKEAGYLIAKSQKTEFRSVRKLCIAKFAQKRTSVRKQNKKLASQNGRFRNVGMLGIRNGGC